MAEDIIINREIIIEADAQTLEKLWKEGRARGFTVYCDEAERTGGDNSAPADEIWEAVVYAMRPAAAKVRDLANEIIAQ